MKEKREMDFPLYKSLLDTYKEKQLDFSYIFKAKLHEKDLDFYSKHCHISLYNKKLYIKGKGTNTLNLNFKVSVL